MITRLKFPPGGQRKFIENVFKKSSLNAEGLAKIINVSPRTIRDWKREKYNITKYAVHVFAETFSTPLPINESMLEENWQKIKIEASRKGGKVHFEKYGDFGTPEGR